MAMAHKPSRSSKPLVVLIATTLSVAMLVLVWWMNRPRAEDIAIQAAEALKDRKFAEAERLARSALSYKPGYVPALLVAGEAAVKLKKIDAALADFQAVPLDATRDGLAAHVSAASILFNKMQLAAAADELQALLKISPGHSIGLSMMVSVLELSGRRYESIPYALQLVESGDFTFDQLVHLGDMEKMIALQAEEVEEMLKIDDAGAQLGVARTSIGYGRYAKARELLTKAIAARPDLLEAQARIASIDLVENKYNDLLAWHSQLPRSADLQPEIWLVRAEWAARMPDLQAEIRCLWEAVRLCPGHRTAMHRLGRALQLAGRTVDAQPFTQLAANLSEIGSIANDLYVMGPSEQRVQRMAELLDRSGRMREAMAWAQLAIQAQSPAPQWAIVMKTRLAAKIKPETGWVADEFNPALKLDLSTLPLPDYTRTPSIMSAKPVMELGAKSPAATAGTNNGTETAMNTNPSGTSNSNAGKAGNSAINDGTSANPPAAGTSSAALNDSGATIRFENVASQRGITFQFRNGDDPTTEGRRMFEYTGGGVAAFDFDRDGYCDLYFTQGRDWPFNVPQTQYKDQLNRNIATDRFADVSELAQLGDTDFSQGAATGDFNGDGFLDLYVANIGLNRLYINQGDGTFQDVSVPAGLKGNWWSTSVAMADLNGDALPELIDINFLTGDDIFTKICREDGVARSCAPAGFPAAPDIVWSNVGDGTFRDISAKCGVDVDNGDGLGLVVADYSNKGKLEFFVANDGRPNFFFVNESAQRGGALRLVEQAVQMGLAYDADGNSQACMGVAVDDADDNGRLDLFVTNFYREHNVLYLQQEGEIFFDESRSAGLLAPSFNLLGFGTQFVDADLDGLPDLIVGNGHVDNFEHKSIPYRMRTQFFRNIGAGKYAELMTDTLGAYFAEPLLTRGMARCDWNRDGKEDLVCSNLDTPISLLSNESQQAGNSISVRLVGTSIERDAIGSSVAVKTAARNRTQQLTAGSGYQASNEAVLVFGIGKASQVESLEVRWVDGTTQSWSNIPAGSEVLAIQGRRELVVLSAASNATTSASQ